MTHVLSPQEIQSRLEQSPWDYDAQENLIRKEFEFPTFMDAVGFVNKIAQEAEAVNHHPDIFLSYRRLKIAVTTHDAGGVTEKDFSLASRIDALPS